jgi:hypothetical protein
MRFWPWISSKGWDRNSGCFCRLNTWCKERCSVITEQYTHSGLNGKLTVNIIIIIWKMTVFRWYPLIFLLCMNSLCCGRSALLICDGNSALNWKEHQRLKQESCFYAGQCRRWFSCPRKFSVDVHVKCHVQSALILQCLAFICVWNAMFSC